MMVFDGLNPWIFIVGHYSVPSVVLTATGKCVAEEIAKGGSGWEALLTHEHAMTHIYGPRVD